VARSKPRGGDCGHRWRNGKFCDPARRHSTGVCRAAARGFKEPDHASARKRQGRCAHGSVGRQVRAALRLSVETTQRRVRQQPGSFVAHPMKQQTLAMAADTGFKQFRRPRSGTWSQHDGKSHALAGAVHGGAAVRPQGDGGRPLVGLERMLRMLFMQHWFKEVEEAFEEALYDSASLRSFVDIDLGRVRVPDGTTLLKFRRLLKKHLLPIREDVFPAVCRKSIDEDCLFRLIELWWV
jgi:IS5 family transposase